MTSPSVESTLVAIGELYISARQDKEYSRILEERLTQAKSEVAKLRVEKRQQEQSENKPLIDETARLAKEVKAKAAEIDNLKLELASAYSEIEAAQATAKEAEDACKAAAARLQQLEDSSAETPEPSALPAALIERDKLREELTALKTDAGVAARHLKRAMRSFNDDPDKSARSLRLAKNKLEELGAAGTASEEDDDV